MKISLVEASWLDGEVKDETSFLTSVVVVVGISGPAKALVDCETAWAEELVFPGFGANLDDVKSMSRLDKDRANSSMVDKDCEMSLIKGATFHDDGAVVEDDGAVVEDDGAVVAVDGAAVAADESMSRLDKDRADSSMVDKDCDISSMAAIASKEPHR